MGGKKKVEKGEEVENLCNDPDILSGSSETVRLPELEHLYVPLFISLDVSMRNHTHGCHYGLTWCLPLSAGKNGHAVCC